MYPVMISSVQGYLFVSLCMLMMAKIKDETRPNMSSTSTANYASCKGHLKTWMATSLELIVKTGIKSKQLQPEDY